MAPVIRPGRSYTGESFCAEARDITPTTMSLCMISVILLVCKPCKNLLITKQRGFFSNQIEEIRKLQKVFIKKNKKIINP
jgi:hypothetical protein